MNSTLNVLPSPLDEPPAVTRAPTTQLEEAPVVARLREQSFNRAAAHEDHEGAVAAHHVVRAELLDRLIVTLAKEPAPELLRELRASGLLWSVVAQVVGVTDAAIRKWRKDQPIEDAHRRRLARLVGLGRLYRKYVIPADRTGFAEWLDTRILDDFSATPLQLLALNRESDSSRLQPLLDWMLDQPDRTHAEALLDRYLGTEWRHEAQTEQRFRIVTSANGDRVLIIDE
jgi:hypothetical protein